MGWRFSLTFLSLFVACLILLAVVTGTVPASAQDRLDIFVTPIPNAPFSGVVYVDRSIVQRDGSIVTLKTMRDIHRDSQGRIYNEARELVPVTSKKIPNIRSIHLYDPQTRISAMIDPHARTFWTMTVNRPPATVPPGLLYASPAGSGLPQNDFTREEDLGIHDIEGVSAHGVRETQTIPAEQSGIGTDVVITDEYWYSEALRINLMIKHSDPRTGSVTMTVAEITRTEPDPALFEIPYNYKPAKGMR